MKEIDIAALLQKLDIDKQTILHPSTSSDRDKPAQKPQP